MLERTEAFPRTTRASVPAVTDLVGYDALVTFMRREGVDRMQGDFLEIGCFLGGGTAKLARLAQATGKLVWVIDVFDPGFDHTANTNGDRMADLYHGYLQSSSQEAIFRAVTKPWADCIRVIKEDSRKSFCRTEPVLPLLLAMAITIPSGSRTTFG